MEETINEPPTGSREASKKNRKKPADLFEQVYTLFKKWCDENKVDAISENVLLEYFHKLSFSMRSTTLRSHYIMLHSTIHSKNNIDIHKYKRLGLFLRGSNGYKVRKYKILTSEEIQRFLITAPDKQYLFDKVGLIFGVFGTCRREELANVELKDIKDVGTELIVRIPDAKTATEERLFVVRGYFYDICKKYVSLRPANLSGKLSDSFFLTYRDGVCTECVPELNRFGLLAVRAAEYLGLREPLMYSGPVLTRPATRAATLRELQAAADLTALKREGAGPSAGVSDGRGDGSLNNKIQSAFYTILQKKF